MLKIFEKVFNKKEENFSSFILKRTPKIIFDNNVVYDFSKEIKLEDIYFEFLDYDKKDVHKNIFTIYENILDFRDKLLIESSDIQFSIISVNSGFIGREFNKTCSFSNTKINTCKEILFQVVSGSGYFLIQNNLESLEENVLDIVKVNEGDYILIEKDKIFTIINSSTDTNLILISLKEAGYKLNFSPLKNRYGSFLYLTKSGFIKNKNTSGAYKLNEYSGNYIKDLYFDKNIGLYKEFINIPEKFNFLKE